MADFLAKIEIELECCICQELLKQPRTLPCQHTFCGDCIQRHSDSSGNGRTFKCPICRKCIEIPDGNDFSKFPVSLLCNNLMDILATSSVDGASPSQGLSLCGEKLHDKEPLNHYCNTCDRFICQACVDGVSRHNGHLISTVDEAGLEQQVILLEQKQHLEQKRAEFLSALQQLEHTEEQLDLYCRKAKQDVDRTTEELRHIIDQRRRDVMLQIAGAATKGGVDGARAVENSDYRLSSDRQLTELCEETQTVIVGPTREILQAKNCLRDRIKRILNRKKVEAKLKISPFICFQSSNTKEMFIKEGLGHLTEHTACLESPLGQALQAMSPVNLKITATFSGLSDVVELNVVPEMQVKNVNISERIGGGLDVVFTPRAPGEFTVMARISGNHIVNSPMKIRVDSQLVHIAGEFNIRSVNKPIQFPYDIAVSSDYTLVAITDFSGNCVYVLDMDGEVKTTITGSGKNKLKAPSGVSFMLNAESIVVADQVNRSVRVFNHKTGKHVWSKSFAGDQLDRLWSMNVHVNKAGHVIACAYDAASKSLIVTYDASGNELMRGYPEDLTGSACTPRCCITNGDFWVIADSTNNCIHVVNMRNTSQRWKIGSKVEEEGEFRVPRGLAIDDDGGLLVCDYWNNRIQKFTLEGLFIGNTYESITYPSGIAVIENGHAMVTEWKQGGRVLKVKL